MPGLHGEGKEMSDCIFTDDEKQRILNAFQTLIVHHPISIGGLLEWAGLGGDMSDIGVHAYDAREVISKVYP